MTLNRASRELARWEHLACYDPYRDVTGLRWTARLRVGGSTDPLPVSLYERAAGFDHHAVYKLFERESPFPCQSHRSAAVMGVGAWRRRPGELSASAMPGLGFQASSGDVSSLQPSGSDEWHTPSERPQARSSSLCDCTTLPSPVASPGEKRGACSSHVYRSVENRIRSVSQRSRP